MSNMRVMTWNMAHWSHRRHAEAAWDWALQEVRPDILLVQEALIPDLASRGYVHRWTRAWDTGRQKWGTGLVSRYPLEPARIPPMDDWFRGIPDHVPGNERKAGIYRADNWFCPAYVNVPDVGQVLVGSVHSPAFPVERSRLRGVDVSAMKLKKNPDLWFLDVLFHFLRPMLGERFIVGGDFNASRLLDTTLGERGNNEFFDRIRDEGFVSLHRLFHAEDERTYFKTGKAPHQLDYLYADRPVAARCRSCEVRPCGEFSDHAPVIADFA